MMQLSQALEIAAVHAKHLRRIHQKFAPTFPLSPRDIDNMSDELLIRTDAMVYRFLQLYDLLCQKIFTLFLEEMLELVDEMFYIDRLNKLEKLGILISAEEWKQLRALCKAVTCEYPNHPESTAEHLNKTYESIPILLEVLDRLVERAQG